MTVLVTGATGLIGGHVVDALRRRGVVQRVLVRPGEAVDRLEAAGVEIVRGDLADAPTLGAAVAGVERVLHCAARTGPWGPVAEYRTANVRGLTALLDAALAAGVKRFVHLSSAIVVGTAPGAVDEDAPYRLEPNPYSASKIEGERLLQRAIRERGAPVTILRPGLVYGPHDSASFGRFAALVERGKMVLLGSGENPIPLVYAEDVAEAVILASESPRAAGRTYFVVNDEPVTQRAYLEEIATALGAAPSFRRVPYVLARALAAGAEWAVRAARLDGPPPLTRFGVRLLGGDARISIRRAREELGFEPRVGVCDGVRRSVEWYRGVRSEEAERGRAVSAIGGKS
jgi:nucleoside-diphosphate-sugar epimerase